MQHPLEFVPDTLRKRLFLPVLALTLILFAVFRLLDQPLRTSAAPNGIVSFELARSPQQARAITDSWKEASLLLSEVAGQSNPDIVNIPYAYASFGLGLDYLFMPTYALALGLATLLVAEKHGGWMKALGAVAGWGAVAAAMFDAVENYTLWRVLLGEVVSPYPETAAICASAKFILLAFGILYGLVGWILPGRG